MIMSSSTATVANMNGFKIALCQFKVTSEKDVNIKRAEDLISEACQSSADIVVLPEVWNSPYATTSFRKYAEYIPDLGVMPDKDNHPSTFALSTLAKTCSKWIIGGSIPEMVENQRANELPLLYNTCPVFNPMGEIVAKHRKVHLFDIDVPGKITFKESDSLCSGSDPTVVETPWGLIGIGICYDIRFPEYAMILRQRGCKLLVYPGAFNMVTGPAHWELLQRARAVDNQLFVAACSPARREIPGEYVAYGYSSVVSPWGEVLSCAGHDEEIVYANIDFSKADEMRQNIPCSFQKRNDIYELIDKKKNSNGLSDNGIELQFKRGRVEENDSKIL
jgi:omega-amidase